MQNTAESLQYSIDVRNECKSEEDKRKTTDFEAMLAINQKRFELALSLIDDADHLASINIKLLAMTELNDWTGVCDLLYKIKTNRLNGTRYRVSTEVVNDNQKLSNSSPFSRLMNYNNKIICS